VMYAVKLGYGFSIVCTVPMLLLPLRDTLTQLVSPGTPTASALPPLQFQALTAAVLFTGLLIATAVPNVEFVFGLTGAIAPHYKHPLNSYSHFLDGARCTAPPPDDAAPANVRARGLCVKATTEGRCSVPQGSP
jgi:hypothetical protein